MRKQAKQYEAQIEELYKQIGKLTAQYEWMKKIWNQAVYPMQNTSKADPANKGISLSSQGDTGCLSGSCMEY